MKDPSLSKPFSIHSECVDMNRNRKDEETCVLLEKEEEEETAFSISSNAVVVNQATPHALAKAAYYLIRHPNISKSIGKQGRNTVLSYYTIQRQMKQYEELYLYLHYNRHILN